MKRRVATLEKTVAYQGHAIAEMQSNGSNVHQLEVMQDARDRATIQRRAQLTDEDLRTDLEEEYGATRWATRLIDEILLARGRDRLFEIDFDPAEST